MRREAVCFQLSADLDSGIPHLDIHEPNRSYPNATILKSARQQPSHFESAAPSDTSPQAPVLWRDTVKGLSWFGWLPFEKPCRDAEKDKDRNNRKNSYLRVNLTA